jgi:hypothetical protein
LLDISHVDYPLFEIAQGLPPLAALLKKDSLVLQVTPGAQGPKILESADEHYGGRVSDYARDQARHGVEVAMTSSKGQYSTTIDEVTSRYLRVQCKNQPEPRELSSESK